MLAAQWLKGKCDPRTRKRSIDLETYAPLFPRWAGRHPPRMAPRGSAHHWEELDWAYIGACVLVRWGEWKERKTIRGQAFRALRQRQRLREVRRTMCMTGKTGEPEVAAGMEMYKYVGARARMGTAESSGMGQA